MVPFYTPHVTPEDKLAVLRAIEAGQLSPGPRAAALASAFGDAASFGESEAERRLAVVTSSGTAALACLISTFSRLGRGAVAIPAVGPTAIPNAVCQTGKTPLYVDVDPESGQMSSEALAKILDRKGDDVSSVVYVHALGRVDKENLTRVVTLCRAAGAYLIEDAAPSGLAVGCGRRLGPAAAISLSSTKNVGGGQGGVAVLGAGSREQYEEVRDYVDQGDPDRTWLPRRAGNNLRMADPMAALALSQLKDAARRGRLLALHFKMWTELGLDVVGADDAIPPAQAVTFGSDKMLGFLRERGLDARRQFRPYCEAPASGIGEECREEFPGARRWADEAIYLPYGLGLDADAVYAALDFKGVA